VTHIENEIRKDNFDIIHAAGVLIIDFPFLTLERKRVLSDSPCMSYIASDYSFWRAPNWRTTLWDSTLIREQGARLKRVTFGKQTWVIFAER
jgi:hypothetical protein